LDPYQRVRQKEGGRDGYSRKDPELDGLGSGIKITSGANLQGIQACLTERITHLERHRHSLPPHFPELHELIHKKAHILGDATNGRPAATNDLTGPGMRDLAVAQSTSTIFSSFSADAKFCPRPPPLLPRYSPNNSVATSEIVVRAPGPVSPLKGQKEATPSHSLLSPVTRPVWVWCGCGPGVGVGVRVWVWMRVWMAVWVAQCWWHCGWYCGW